MVFNFQEKKVQQNFVCQCVRQKYVFFNSKWHGTTENAFHSRSKGAIIFSPMYQVGKTTILHLKWTFSLKILKANALKSVPTGEHGICLVKTDTLGKILLAAR